MRKLIKLKDKVMVKIIIKNLDLEEIEVLEFLDLDKFRNYFNSNIVGKPIRLVCPKNDWEIEYTFGKEINKEGENYSIKNFEGTPCDYKIERRFDYTITVFPEEYQAERKFIIKSKKKFLKFNTISDFIKNKEEIIYKRIKKISGTHEDLYGFNLRLSDITYYPSDDIANYELICFSECDGDLDLSGCSYSLYKHEPMNLTFKI
jgi:hypothetical protein